MVRVTALLPHHPTPPWNTLLPHLERPQCWRPADLQLARLQYSLQARQSGDCHGIIPALVVMACTSHRPWRCFMEHCTTVMQVPTLCPIGSISNAIHSGDCSVLRVALTGPRYLNKLQCPPGCTERIDVHWKGTPSCLYVTLT